jgi:predicted MFS family arabinose efflux permease
VQQAVERTKLGIATSLNQFSRSIGGALGVAIMGAVLTAGLGAELTKAAQIGGVLSVEQAVEFASNPNALIEPTAKAALPPETLGILQNAMAVSIHPVFWVGAVMSMLALIVVLFLPKPKKPAENDVDGERLIMAEQTNINARNQPVAERG